MSDHQDHQERFQKAAGAVAFQQLLEPCRPDPVAVVMMQKAAEADVELLKTASLINPEDPMGTYESLGGEYNRKENR